ncbi:Protein ALWAYS EARLY 3 [Frankliniella fusca]|uniref:Protein ALWAYS EARLY 3 n=1 Tax=Frankliniella fusca TaxID=407009 RepID=A0AAE1HJ80_9NEOP|nr:Protein ALWAYS EARLY 3 [Frankliniella fusca]
MIMSQAINVLSLQTFGKCRLRDRTLWNKAMIFLSFFTSSGKAFILLSFKLRFKKTVGLLSLDLKAIKYDCSSILRDKGMLPSPGAIFIPESATKPLPNSLICMNGILAETKRSSKVVKPVNSSGSGSNSKPFTTANKFKL